MRGKCRVFRRKRFTFPRGQQGYRLHRPLSPHLQSPPLGKVPGISAKTVHFPPWPTGALAPQASLAVLGISTSRESAGNSCENGSLSPVADRDTGSTGLSRATWHFHLPGKVPGFSTKTVHFPPQPTGALAPQASLAALTVSTLGESAANSRENGSLSPVARRGTGSTGLSGRTWHKSERWYTDWAEFRFTCCVRACWIWGLWIWSPWTWCRRRGIS